MKSMAIASQLLEKDAWDLDRCNKNHPSGMEELAKEY
jgi:hypothetical protein